MARLQHPNIVAVFDAGTDAGISFVVMQLIDAWRWLSASAPRLFRRLRPARIGGAIADALAHIHAFGMVHRDIKPGNILCGANGTVFLTDFGIVRLGHTRLTRGTIGTVSYPSLEQVRGEDVGTAADIYALALVLLECLTGAPEYSGGVGRFGVGPADPATTRPADRAPELVRPPHGYDDGWSGRPPNSGRGGKDPARSSTDLAARPNPRRGRVATRVRTKPITIKPQMPTASSAPIRHRQRHVAAWLTAAGVFAAVMIIAALVWLLPRDGSSPGSGQQAPTMSPGPDRLHHDLMRYAVSVDVWHGFASSWIPYAPRIDHDARRWRDSSPSIGARQMGPIRRPTSWLGDTFWIAEDASGGPGYMPLAPAETSDP